jgi:hypothetical protein
MNWLASEPEDSQSTVHLYPVTNSAGQHEIRVFGIKEDYHMVAITFVNNINSKQALYIRRL